MIAAARRAGSADRGVLDRLERWDATMRADLVEPLIFTAWERETVRAVYRDDLGSAFERFFSTRALALTRLLEGRATSRDWCDDRSTPSRETCDDVIAGALMTAMAELDKLYGADRAVALGLRTFRLGRASPFGLVPGIASFFNVGVPSPDAYTLLTLAWWNSAMSRRLPTAAARPTGRSTTLPISSTRSTCRPPASREIRSRPLSLLRRTLGQGGVHRDRHQARDHRQGRARHVEPHASLAAHLFRALKGCRAAAQHEANRE